MEALLVSTGIIALAEMGDEMRIAIVVLTAKHHALAAVIAGTMIGMPWVNAPAPEPSLY